VSVPTDVYADLKTEGEILDQMVAGLDATQWELPTPAPGWTIKHQVAVRVSVRDTGSRPGFILFAVTAG